MSGQESKKINAHDHASCHHRDESGHSHGECGCGHTHEEKHQHSHEECGCMIFNGMSRLGKVLRVASN